jgi:hypothetical protein
VRISYPLQRPVVVELAADTPQGFSRGGLVRAIAAAYRRVYEEEEASAGPPPPRPPGYPIFNRVVTDGRYGIYGHDLGDLALVSVEPSAEGDHYELSVDS